MSKDLTPKERKAEYDREYRKRNKERIAEYKRAWERKNSLRISEQKHEYYMKHKKEKKVKVEIEEVLEIVKEKQSRKAESIRRHSAAAKALEGKEDPESKRKRDLETQAMCEALSSFLTLCEVYASISAMESRKNEQEEA